MKKQQRKKMKIIIEFTKLNLDGTLTPYHLDIEEVVKIDYGNYGTSIDRHYWPGLHEATEGRTERPRIIIYTKTGKIIAFNSIKFRHY